MSTYEDKLREMRKKYGSLGAIAPAAPPITADPAPAAPTSQGSKGNTFEERSAALTKKWGAPAQSAPAANTPAEGALGGTPEYPTADYTQTMRDAIPLYPKQAPAAPVNFAPADQNQINPGAPDFGSAPVAPASAGLAGRARILEDGLNTDPQMIVKEHNFATAGAEVGPVITAAEKARQNAEEIYQARQGGITNARAVPTIPSPEQQAADAHQQAVTYTADLASRRQKYLTSPLGLLGGITNGEITPDDVSQLKADDPKLKVVFNIMAGAQPLPPASRFNRDEWADIGKTGQQDPAAGLQAILDKMGAREQDTLFRHGRIAKQTAAEGLSLGAVQPTVAPQTKGEQVTQFGTAVLSQIPAVTAAAMTGGATAGALADSAGIVNPLVRSAITAGGTGLTLAVAKEAVGGAMRPDEFDPKKAAQNILSTTAEYAAFGPAYEGLGIAGEAIGKRAPALAKAVQAVERVPIAGEVITGGVKGAIAGGGVGVGKAALEALATPEGRDAKSFVQTVLSNAKEEMAEELVEAIAMGIVHKFVPMNAHAVLETGHELKASAGTTAQQPAPLTTPINPETEDPRGLKSLFPKGETVQYTVGEERKSAPVVGYGRNQDGAWQVMVDTGEEIVPVTREQNPTLAGRDTQPVTVEGATPAPSQAAPPVAEASPAPALDRSALLRERNPGMDEKAILDMVNATGNLSDQEFQAFAERAGKPEAAASPALEPWNMTKEQFEAANVAPVDILRDSSVVDLVRTHGNLNGYGEGAPKGTWDQFKADIRDNGIKKPVELTVNKDGSIDIIEGTHRLLAAAELGLKTVPAEVRGDWTVLHKLSVKQALTEGKPVPPEVLAGYPDLGANAGSSSATTTTTAQELPAPTGEPVLVPSSPLPTKPQSFGDTVEVGQTVALPRAGQFEVVDTSDKAMVKVREVGKEGAPVFSVGREVLKAPANTPTTAPQPAPTGATPELEQARQRVVSAGQAINSVLDPIMARVYGAAADSGGKGAVTTGAFVTHVMNGGEVSTTTLRTALKLPQGVANALNNAYHSSQALRDAIKERGEAIEALKPLEAAKRQAQEAPAPTVTPTANPKPTTTKAQGTQTPLPPEGLSVRTSANYKGEAQRKAAADYGKAIDDWSAQNNNDLQGFQLVRALFSDGQWRPAIRTTQAGAKPAPGWVQITSERGDSAGAFYAVDHAYRAPTQATAPTPSTDTQPTTTAVKEIIATGNTTTAKTERGTEVQTQYALVDAGNLVASHDTALKANPDYPQELQPRDRSRMASEDQINRIVGNLEPSFLGASPKASEGAPIVGPDLVVESGNGRTIALQRAYEQGHKSGETYKQWLVDNAESFGLDPEAVKGATAPVLVRIRQTEVDRADFASQANEQAVAAMSATEQAVSDAKKLTGDVMHWFNPTDAGEIVHPGNRDFIRAFLQKVVGPTEQGRYLTAEGALSQEGISRIRNAVFAKAYGDSSAIEKLAESPDNNVRSITTGMLTAAGRTAQVKDGIAKGQYFPVDLSQDITAAMAKLSQLRESGQTVADYLHPKQLAFFEDNLSDLSKDILDVFEQHKRSPKKIGALLMAYADAVEAAGDPRQQTLWGKVNPTKAELWQAAVQTMEAESGGRVQASLFEDPGAGGPGVAAANEAGGSTAQAEQGQEPLSVREQLRQKTEQAMGREGLADERGSFNMSGGPVRPNAPGKPQGYTFGDPDTEERYQTSKGITPPSMWDKLRETWETFKNQSTREWEHLPRTAEFAQLRFSLNRLKQGRAIAGDQTIRHMQGLTVKFTPAKYDLFSRKVVLDDIMADVEIAQDKGEAPKLAFGFTPDTAKKAHAEVSALVDQDADVKAAVAERKALVKEIVDEYMNAADEAVGYRPPLNRRDYFRHQVLAYQNLTAPQGAGQKLKAPTGRGFTKAREGSELDYNTEYRQAEFEWMAQMLYDTQVFNLLKTVKAQHDIAPRLKAEAKAAGENWQDKPLPEGYVLWQPREGNMAFQAYSLPEKAIRQAMDQAVMQNVEYMEVFPEDLRKVMVMGARRPEIAIPENVAKTLDQIGRVSESGVVDKAVRKMVSAWKHWQLLSPMRVLKYNLNNLSGDVDAAVFNAGAFKRVPKAAGDLYNFLIRKAAPSVELDAWLARGGLEVNQQVAEGIHNLNGLEVFWNLADTKAKGLGTTVAELPKTIWDGYWKTARMGSDFREALLRYANFLEYTDQIKTNGRPKNFGASLREEVLALADPHDQAFKLSNDLMGAYNEVTVTGQWIRDRLYPFWSFQEVNARRYYRLMRNTWQDNGAMIGVGKTAASTMAKVVIKSPLMALRIGKFVMGANLLMAALSAWNYLMFPDDEENLSKDVRSRPHIILGHDSKGKPQYTTVSGSWYDFISWFGLNQTPTATQDFLSGRKSIKEIVADMAKAPVNKIAGGMGGPTKSLAEVAIGRSTYPDIFHTTPVRDRWEQLFGSYGLRDEYKALAGKPMDGAAGDGRGVRYLRTWPKKLVVQSDPLETAYYDIRSAKYDYLEAQGKGGGGGDYTARSNALYYFKLAMRYNDEEAAKKYLVEYGALGGTKEGIKDSIATMDPLGGLSKENRKAFLDSLDPAQRATLKDATEFYDKVLKGGDYQHRAEYRKLPLK